jgi:hypothetical protein
MDIHYADALSVLQNNNILFSSTDGGFTLTRSGEVIADIDMGPFSAPFLNRWMANTVSGFAPFPVGFSGARHLSIQGELSKFSEDFAKEAAASDMSAQEADAKAVALFLSDEIVTTGVNKIFKMDAVNVNALAKADFEDEGVVSFLEDPPDSAEDVMAEERIDVAQSVRPFYHVIKMVKRGRTLTELPKIWVDKIAEDGLSWEFVDGRLFVSNTVGASRGFPPAPDHLCGLADLGLQIKDAESTPVSVEAVAKKPITASSESEQWKIITAQFLEKPCMASFGAFRDAESIAKAYNDHKKDPGYKMGSRKNPLTDGLRKVMRGEDKAITWNEFVELLGLTARPSDIKGQMILLFKIRLYVEQTEEGKVYVSE